jgi:hypothetical protein
MRLTGIKGVLDTAAAGAASGRSGNGDRTLAGSGLGWVFLGVVGNDDRIRGVPLMAFSCTPKDLDVPRRDIRGLVVLKF